MLRKLISNQLMINYFSKLLDGLLKNVKKPHKWSIIWIISECYSTDTKGFVLVHLRHPKSHEAALFSFKNCPDSKEVREIISVNQEFGLRFLNL